MTPRLISFDSSGLDTAAGQIITERWPHVRAFFERHLSSDPRWHDDLLLAHAHTQLLPIFRAIEDQVTKVHSPREAIDARRRGRSRWQAEYLLPLAEALGVRSTVEEQSFQSCWRRGLFDRAAPAQSRGPIDEYFLPRPRLIRRDFKEVLCDIRELL